MKTPESMQPTMRESAPAALSPLAKAGIGAALLLGGIGLIQLLQMIGPAIFGIDNPSWYLSRSSALISFVCLWISMALGIGISNKLTRIWPGAFTAFDLHQFTSLLGSVFLAIHVLTLVGDKYIGYDLFQVLVPFASTAYEQLWVGLGQVAMYLMIPVTLSFYARKRLGTRGWRTIHGVSYGLFGLALLHGLFSGTDSGSWWAQALYGFSGVSVFALTVYRVLVSRNTAQAKKVSPPAASARLAS
jgi:predicted ferric reductase